MRRLIVVLLVAALAPGAVADAKKPRKRLHAKVHKARKAKPPKSWKRVAFRTERSDLSVRPAPVPTPAPAVTPAPDGPPPPPPPPLPEADPRSVSVNSTEWALTLSQPAVLAGDVRVQFDNSRAEDPHSLSAFGPGTWGFDEIAAGAVVAKTVTLKAGTYTVICPLPQHEERGMSAQLTVRPD